MDTDPAISELLSFFDFAHLRERTPHLAEASAPFHEAAHAAARHNFAAIGLVEVLRARMITAGDRESAAAVGKLDAILAEWDHDRTPEEHRAADPTTLRLLLEAKDCAVRAALVRERALQADADHLRAEALTLLAAVPRGVETLAGTPERLGLLYRAGVVGEVSRPDSQGVATAQITRLGAHVLETLHADRAGEAGKTVAPADLPGLLAGIERLRGSKPEGET
jgi:hypothetical protein